MLDLLNSLAFSWQVSSIILKLFFEKRRKSKDFFILGYLFTNFTIDISNSMVDLLIPKFLTISFYHSFQICGIFGLVGRPAIQCYICCF